MDEGEKIRITSNLTFKQVYDLSRLMYADFKDWNAYAQGIIDEEGKLLIKGRLNWAEIWVRNLKLLLLKSTIVKGRWGQRIFDANTWRFIRFLKESKKIDPFLATTSLTEAEAQKFIFTEKGKKLNQLLEDIKYDRYR